MVSCKILDVIYPFIHFFIAKSTFIFKPELTLQIKRKDIINNERKRRVQYGLRLFKKSLKIPNIIIKPIIDVKTKLAKIKKNKYDFSTCFGVGDNGSMINL